MNSQMKDYIGISIVAGIILSVIALFWFAFSYSESVEPNTNFSVDAQGEVVAVPDVAEVTATVITEGGEDLGVLQNDNSEKMNGLIDYVKDQGVEDEDIRTSSYNISPRYQNYRCPEGGEVCPPREIVGYTVNQDVTIKIRDFSKIGTILSGAVEEGANSVSNLRFTIDDPTEVQNEARGKAIEKAKKKAEAIAKDTGFKLGKIISVHESANTPYPRYEELGRGGVSMDSAASAPSIEPGSQEVKVNVSITYQIK